MLIQELHLFWQSALAFNEARRSGAVDPVAIEDLQAIALNSDSKKLANAAGGLLASAALAVLNTQAG